jgi:hypothetical protein
MPAVKALVVGLGVLLLAGIALLIYGIVQKAADPKFKLLEVGSASDTSPGTFGETSLVLPEACTITEMRPDGPRLYLRTGPAGACERILVIDAATGRFLGTIRLRP